MSCTELWSTVGRNSIGCYYSAEHRSFDFVVWLSAFNPLDEEIASSVDDPDYAAESRSSTKQTAGLSNCARLSPLQHSQLVRFSSCSTLIDVLGYLLLVRIYIWAHVYCRYCTSLRFLPSCRLLAARLYKYWDVCSLVYLIAEVIKSKTAIRIPSTWFSRKLNMSRFFLPNST